MNTRRNGKVSTIKKSIKQQYFFSLWIWCVLGILVFILFKASYVRAYYYEDDDSDIAIFGGYSTGYFSPKTDGWNITAFVKNLVEKYEKKYFPAFELHNFKLENEPELLLAGGMVRKIPFFDKIPLLGFFSEVCFMGGGIDAKFNREALMKDWKIKSFDGGPFITAGIVKSIKTKNTSFGFLLKYNNLYFIDNKKFGNTLSASLNFNVDILGVLLD